MTFQRARSAEQREARRRAILDTAATMLDEMPVADLSLNELSRRVGLAKSNVLRYFESREAVLLELLDHYLGTWLDELADELAADVDPRAGVEERSAQLAVVLSRSLAVRMRMCELFGAQGSVLERNVSLEVVVRYKRASLQRLATMTELTLRCVPELGGAAQLFCLNTMIVAGALSAYASPMPAVLAAYEAEPDLAVIDLDVREALRLAIVTGLLGTVPR
ncbi:TetR/AcrR family transcriptional regulator [Cryptosporangium japonicum]|uniref:TetR family transcriptional regulator n=1 Tax=Cryptosporangium japonicum TaxID=80872 RepID=A0ABN0V4A8_9ACTN